MHGPGAAGAGLRLLSGCAAPHTVAAWFAGRRELSAVVEAVLEGRQGYLTIDEDAARLSLGCYEIFGGDPACDGARRLVLGAAAPVELVYGNDSAWRRCVRATLGDAVVDRPMRDFDPAGLDLPALRRIAAAVPSGFAVRALDARLAARLDREIEPHALQVFADPAAFAAGGFGYGVVAPDGRLASAATTYSHSAHQVEVAIATRPGFRGLGLATAVAAALLVRCVEDGKAPRWSASNPVSHRLAARLGYRPAGVCEVLVLH